MDCSFIPLALSYHGAVAGDRSYKGNGAGVVMPLLRLFMSFQYKQFTFFCNSSVGFSSNTRRDASHLEEYIEVFIDYCVLSIASAGTTQLAFKASSLLT